jgi:hypothetical protein
VKETILNTEVATGWMQYGGLDRFDSYLIDPKASLQIFQRSGEWAEKAGKEFAPRRGMTVEHGECVFSNGSFAGRFLALSLDRFWGSGGFALVVSVRDGGGDRNGGAVVVSCRARLQGVVEDVGRAMCLEQSQRREGVRAVLAKWENSNPPEWRGRYQSPPGVMKRLLSWVSGG